MLIYRGIVEQGCVPVACGPNATRMLFRIFIIEFRTQHRVKTKRRHKQVLRD